MMRVSRVVVEAPVTSFRHPFFVTGRQPTFTFPPPSTVFGHCASAMGTWPDPTSFFFGLHFTWRARAGDLEHQHITTALSPKSRTLVATPGGQERATTEINIQPVKRDFLFDVRMTLYLPTNIGAAFRYPVHTMVLGRSQDLAEVREITETDLKRPGRARIEHTLLPSKVRPCVRFGTTVLLSRHVGEPPKREASFAQYIALHEPVFLGDGADPNRAFISVEGLPLDDLWIDPQHADDGGFARGVWLHRIVGPE